ncbi:MAG: phosphomannomutase/phosphoglucomutase [Planctomycetota bacterium]
MSVFKAYDIRGVYGEQIDEKLAVRVGGAFARFLGAGPIAVGRDMRASSPAMASAVISGIRAAGIDVVDVGCVSTPALYFAVLDGGLRGGVQVTASHNPSQYTGMKFCREGGAPVGSDSGLAEVQRMAESSDEPPAAEKPGTVTTRDLTADYRAHVRRFLGERASRPLKIVVDAANAMGGADVPICFADDPDLEIVPLYFELDGTFPNHEANPLEPKNLRDVQAAVKEHGADLGAAFDGDADRCAFIDEQGRAISCDIVTILLARTVLAGEPGAKVVYDLRSSDAVAEVIQELGGVPLRERVGHAFIKATMRREDAALGGELSGHYYFRENGYCDSGAIALASVLKLLRNSDQPLSALVADGRRYFATGELNFHVDDADATLERIQTAFPEGESDELDGVTIRLPKLWFNVRKSNTEPIVRLNLEGRTAAAREKGLDRVLAILGEPEGGRPSYRD